ncbi:MAG: hypothetical protein PHE70_07100, partial [Tepidanaerobacteraceae bacterium]|nr:hypothetical protein [Tepidanaerobacteraceae bacterium]
MNIIERIIAQKTGREVVKAGDELSVLFPRDLTDKWEFPIRYGIDSVLAVTPFTHMMGYLVY